MVADGRSVPDKNTFPDCPTCPLLKTAKGTVCYRCAAPTLPRPRGETCPVCGQEGYVWFCQNRTCTLAQRGFGRVHVIAMLRDELRDRVHWLKYEGKRGWAVIFGRIIVGYLNEHEDEMLQAYDLIVPNPTFAAPGKVQHTELTIAAAADNDDNFWGWPFDKAPWALVKTEATPKSATNKWDEKQRCARLHAHAITIDDARIKGKRILLYDDVFTTGAQFDQVGHKLQHHGAASVDGLVLARAPWRT
jgi:predicted amidophosphoribosyltransferase